MSEDRLRCYRTTVMQRHSFVISDNPNRAKQGTMFSANEAGYGVKYIDIRCKRFPEYDHLAKPLPCSRILRINTPYTLDYMENPCGCAKCRESEQR